MSLLPMQKNVMDDIRRWTLDVIVVAVAVAAMAVEAAAAAAITLAMIDIFILGY